MRADTLLMDHSVGFSGHLSSTR